MKLNELMPHFDLAARYETRVNASVERTREAMRNADFSELPFTQLLMRLRTLAWRGEKPERSALQKERLRAAGVVSLPTGSESEFLLGVVGRFWRADSGIVRGLAASELIAFELEGYAKALWNFTAEPVESNVTRLATETRVLTYGTAARRKFRAYWLLVGPFSGLIRKEMLRLVKRDAERV